MKQSRLKEFLKRIDFVILITTMIIFGISIFVIDSATRVMANSPPSSRFVTVQSVAFVVGLIVMIGLTFVDYEHLSSFYLIIGGACVVLLILVLIFAAGVGKTGVHRYFNFFGIGFQPSELAKIGFVITFAKHLTMVKEDGINKARNILPLVGHLAVYFILVMIEPDLGSALVFLFAGIGMLIVAGVRKRYIFISAAFVSIVSPLIYKYILRDYQQTRIDAILDPSLKPEFAYQAMQSKLAIGSGEFFGRGLYRGTITQMATLPAKHTDAIIGVVGEELGFLGCIILLTLLVVIVIRCIHIAMQSRDYLGSYICVGIAFILIFQIFENIGMNMGMTPITGVTLPFISYGGTSLVTNFAALGIVLSVRYRRKAAAF